MKRILLSLFLFLSFLNADIKEFFPKLDARVVDTANVLSSSTKNNLEEILKNHEEQTSNQIIVVMLKSLNDYEISDFTYQLGRFWQIGQKDLNNGVILLASIEDRKIRIEVGYGLEGALTDKISHEIIEYTIKPKFKREDYDAGVLNAVNEIIEAIKGEYEAKENTALDFQSNDLFAFLFFGVIFISIFLNSISMKVQSQFLYKLSKSSIFSSFFGFFTFLMAQSYVSFYDIVAIVIFVLTFIFNFISIKNVDFNKLKELSNNSSSGFNGFDGFNSRGSKGSRGGGFSGGRGGSFGGGGASGSW